MTLGCNFSAMIKHLCAGRWDFTDRCYREEDLDDLKGWSEGLECGAVICTVTCVRTGNISSANVTRGETLGCTSWSKQDSESLRSCVHGNVKWYPRMYQAENSPKRSGATDAIMQRPNVLLSEMQRDSFGHLRSRQDKCKVGGGKVAKEPLNSE